MRINIVTNIRDGKGLLRDAQILEEILKSLGHSVDMIDFRERTREIWIDGKKPNLYDLQIHLEIYAPSHFPAAIRQWLIPNPEWWDPQLNKHLSEDYDLVLCKTRHGYSIFEKLCHNAVLTGFSSRDIRSKSVPRERMWIHVAGGSIVKGTRAVLEAWEVCQLSSPLLVVGDHIDHRPVKNVRYVSRLADDEYTRAMNRCLFHIQPSEVEGFGHVLHETLGVGGLLVTTDAPPMSEVVSAIKIKPKSFGTQRLSQTSRVDAEGVAAAVEVAESLSDSYVEMYTTSAREEYEAERGAFKAKLEELLK